MRGGPQLRDVGRRQQRGELPEVGRGALLADAHLQGDGVGGQVGDDALAVAVVPGALGEDLEELAGGLQEKGAQLQQGGLGLVVARAGLLDVEAEQREEGPADGRGDEGGDGEVGAPEGGRERVGGRGARGGRLNEVGRCDYGRAPHGLQEEEAPGGGG